jgi:hypothetical protein
VSRVTKPVDPFSPRNQVLLYASDASVLLSCGYLGLRFGHGWSWWLFVWAVAAALLVVPSSLFVGWLSRRPLSAEQRATAVAELRRRAVPLYLPTLSFGAAVGILAARWQSPLPDVLLTATALLCGLLLPLALLHRRRRLPPVSLAERR